MSAAALILAAYLVGSISFSLLIARALRGFDIRERGSGNAGASNVLRVVGKGPAAAVLCADVAKGALPVAAARLADAPGPVVGAVALAAVVGHVFPVFHGFRGGKGVATAAGALGGLALVPAALAAAVFLGVVGTTRYVALASVAAVTSFPLWLYLAGRTGWAQAPAWLMASAVALALLITVKHHDNLSRLLAGTELRLGDPDPEEETA